MRGAGFPTTVVVCSYGSLAQFERVETLRRLPCRTRLPGRQGAGAYAMHVQAVNLYS